MEGISDIIDTAEEITGVIEQDVVVAGVTSINGEAGDLNLKTINNTDLLGEGNLDLQEPLIAGENITIDGNVISAAGSSAAYTAGNGLTLNGDEFSIDEDVVATKEDLTGKQDTLTTTQLNAVNSGIDSTKVSQIATNETDISTIEGKIPTQASTSNQLADKNFVNSSISTNTANFVGTFNSLAELESVQNPTNNDYGFVIGTDSAGNTVYNRYKFNGTQWLFEYALNNSSFTSGQWAAINSGITSGDVTKLTGLVDIKSLGANLSLDANGELSATDTTYSAFTGTDGQTAGSAGLVPAPATTDDGKYLKADGTWGTVNAGPTVVQTTGTSTTDVMSQDAVSSQLYAKYNGAYQTSRIKIGDSATESGARGVAIGTSAVVTASGAIALGAGSKAENGGEMNIGTTNASWGYNSTNYRLLTGLYDPQSAHDAATKGYVDGLVGNIESALHAINNGGNA